MGGATMGTGIEKLDLLLKAEKVCDAIWAEATRWERFKKETIGSQLIRAADSIGANVAEGHGRYHYGEKLNFMYYARGSLFETQYWLRRCQNRSLIKPDVLESILTELDAISRSTNGYINYLRNQRKTN